MRGPHEQGHQVMYGPDMSGELQKIPCGWTVGPQRAGGGRER